RGTTEGINLVAQTFGRTFLKAGDQILISTMEHHANIVPWQMLCEQVGAELKVIPMHADGTLDLEAYTEMLTPQTKLVSVVHVSNALGTVNPVKQMIEMAHQHDIPVLLDGAQAAPHVHVDVQALDCDFFVCSGHKIYGPTGIGVLYAKAKWLEQMPPYQGGGDMIDTVTFEKTTYQESPFRFEAGTPNIAGGIGLDAAMRYMQALDLDAAHAHTAMLLREATSGVQDIPGLRLVGTAPEKVSVLSFVIDQIHPHDIGTILDQEGIAVRTGHHCAQPLMSALGLPATTRASFTFYNTLEEVERLVQGLHKVVRIFTM
ncbi:MAG: cysteine desulfurase, partial [Myxococcota bacterium]